MLEASDDQTPPWDKCDTKINATGSCFQMSQTLVANTARRKRTSSSMQLSPIRAHDGSPNPGLGAWSKMGFPGKRWNDTEADTDVAGGQVQREAMTFWAQEAAAKKAWTRRLLRNCKELSEGWGEVKQEEETEASNRSQFWTFFLRIVESPCKVQSRYADYQTHFR